MELRQGKYKVSLECLMVPEIKNFFLRRKEKIKMGMPKERKKKPERDVSD